MTHYGKHSKNALEHSLRRSTSCIHVHSTLGQHPDSSHFHDNPQENNIIVKYSEDINVKNTKNVQKVQSLLSIYQFLYVNVIESIFITFKQRPRRGPIQVY